MRNLALFLLALLGACMPVGDDRAANEANAGSEALLIQSNPADGASVRAPRLLSLTFREPVRLAEVTIIGPSGEMPMMITAAGEQRTYSVPLPDLEPGRHEVKWRALAQGGVAHEGRLSFTVR
jgi:methionine-rich copper-binding protein CopC